MMAMDCIRTGQHLALGNRLRRCLYPLSVSRSASWRSDGVKLIASFVWPRFHAKPALSKPRVTGQ